MANEHVVVRIHRGWLHRAQDEMSAELVEVPIPEFVERWRAIPQALRDMVEAYYSTEASEFSKHEKGEAVSDANECLDWIATAPLETDERAELENFRRMYAGDQERTDEHRKMMLDAQGLEKGPGFEAILIVLCANHRTLREKVKQAIPFPDVLPLLRAVRRDLHGIMPDGIGAAYGAFMAKRTQAQRDEVEAI